MGTKAPSTKSLGLDPRPHESSESKDPRLRPRHLPISRTVKGENQRILPRRRANRPSVLLSCPQGVRHHPLRTRTRLAPWRQSIAKVPPIRTKTKDIGENGRVCPRGRALVRGRAKPKDHAIIAENIERLSCRSARTPRASARLNHPTPGSERRAAARKPATDT